MDEFIVEAKGLFKSFSGKEVLTDISLGLKRGTFNILLGKNGAGKSTLINVLMGLERPNKGFAKVLGYNALSDWELWKSRVGFVSESINFDLPTVLEEFVKYYSRLYPRFDHDFFHSICDKQQIDLKRKYKDFSRGQKMQTALILALAIRPEIIFIDEVTSVLDVYARSLYLNLLRNFTQDGGTVVLTTNIISEVQFYADKILLLKEGKIALNANIKDIPHEFIKVRKNNGFNHSVFDHDQCFWVGKNTDGSDSYIISKKVMSSFSLPEEIIDRRAIKLEELFIFYMKENEVFLGDE